MKAISDLLSGDFITLESAIRQSAAVFEQNELVYGHGTVNAIDEASWLILHALNLPAEQQPDYQRVLTEHELGSCNELISRRITQRLPAAYLTGTAWFAGLEFKSDARALVPRSPIAELIQNDFFGLIDLDKIKNVLDLCTGGGCIAIACAVNLPESKVDASDISEEALSLAAENVQMYHLQEQVSLIQSSLFDNIPGTYDLIVSNPPYVDAADIEAMGQEFSHEPLLGLAAGEDGLDLVRIMLNEAAEKLSDHGLLIVEVGNSAPAIEALYPEVPFLWLEFSNGGSGVFALTKTELTTHKRTFQQKLKTTP